MDIAAALAAAQITRVAIVDDDLAPLVSLTDLREHRPDVAALLNDPHDPDYEAYAALLTRKDFDVATLTDLAEPLASEDVRAEAPARLREAGEAVLAARAERAEPVQRVMDLLVELGVAVEKIDRYWKPEIGQDKIYDLIIVDYFLVDTSTEATIPFIRSMLDRQKDEDLPLQVILMSSHDEQLKHEFREIRPELKVSSSRMRIMQKPQTDIHLVGWRAAFWQLANDRKDVPKLERFITDAGTVLESAGKSASQGLWEVDLQAVDLLHELASKDHDDYVRYVEDALSRRLLSEVEADGGMRASLQALDGVLQGHRTQNLRSPSGEVGNSTAAIHGIMHSMEWRSGQPELPPYPAGAPKADQSRWVKSNIRFGMVLLDPDGGYWLNITQACDLAQAKETDFGSTSVLFVRGGQGLPSVKAQGDYFVQMTAMMASHENHVLTWNLRDVRSESIESFGASYGAGWQVIGELRPDRAQDIAAKFGARAARVGLPVTLPVWRLSGCAMRIGPLSTAPAVDPIAGVALAGHAVKRASTEKHELRLDLASLDALLTEHGAIGDSVVELLKGVPMSPGKKAQVGGKVWIAYKASACLTVSDARVDLDDVIDNARNAESVLVMLWSAP